MNFTHFGGPSFVVAIILICTAGWVINTWIRAKHGYPLEDEWGGKTERDDPAARRNLELLATENERLKGQVLRLEDRLGVLERIATDPAERTAREIENLR
jgi:hypothetical protein